jgi:hypothetical protein
LVVSFSQNETCCATRKKRQVLVNAESHPLQDEFYRWCFCGTSLYLGSAAATGSPHKFTRYGFPY